jgi:hypothetical protein
MKLVAGRIPFIVFTNASPTDQYQCGGARDQLARIVYMHGGLRVVQKSISPATKSVPENEVLSTIMEYYWSSVRWRIAGAGSGKVS